MFPVIDGFAGETDAREGPPLNCEGDIGGTGGRDLYCTSELEGDKPAAVPPVDPVGLHAANIVPTTWKCL